MQREPCQWYLLKIIKLRESSLFLASFYLLLKCQVCQNLPGPGPGSLCTYVQPRTGHPHLPRWLPGTIKPNGP